MASPPLVTNELPAILRSSPRYNSTDLKTSVPEDLNTDV